jgi:murein DD-endopeptidase MepM/ murein hydrolase activator NlpD
VASWLTAGSGILQGRIPEKFPFAAPSPEKLGTSETTPFDDTGAMSPVKTGTFGDDGAFTGGTIGKIGFGDDGAFGSGIAKMGYGEDLTLPSLAIKQSTATAQQGQPGQPGAGLNAGIGGTTPGAGGLGQASGEFSVLNQYDTAFRTAAAKFGLDPNDLKAIAMIERGWEGSGVSPSGAVGIMQVMPQYWGDKGYDIYSVEGNIMAGALAYKSFYDQYKDEAIARGMDPKVAAARAYLAGNPWSGASDAYGTTTDIYGSRFEEYRGQLGGSGGAFGGSGSIQQMFGVGAVPDWGEFNVPSGNGLYGYGTQYGLNGSNHTGVDVPMNLGTAYYAPASGTVMCAGTGVGQGADGGGCAAFNDYYGQGAGRVEVLLDNGAVLIFGHSSTSALRPGQRFNAGQALGTSGGQNSPHIHLEARVKDASTPSGWRIVDPRSVLGGGGTYPAPSTTTGGGYPSAAQRMLDIIRRGG